MPFPLIPVAGLLIGATGLFFTLRGQRKIPPAIAQAAISSPPRAAPTPAAHVAAQVAAVIAENPGTSEEEGFAAVSAANTAQFIEENKLNERRSPIMEQTRDAPAPTTREPVSFVRENPTPAAAPAAPDEEDDSVLSSITSLFDGELR